MKDLVYECRGPVAWLTINRPPLNLLGEDTWRELGEALGRAGDDQAARVVVITGVGDRAFSAGADVKELPLEMGLMESLASAWSLQRLLTRIERFHKPTIAAVNGYALGGGCELAVACTFRIASERAQFGVPEINLGIVPALGGCQRLVRLIGLAWASEMVLTGRRVDAQEAYRIGLANRVVAAPQLQSAVQDFGETLAEKSPAALALALAALRANQEASAQTADLLNSALFTLSSQTEESREARRRLFGKRD